MNQLSDVYQFLAAGLQSDPLLCLAHAATWLDPFRAGLLGDEVNDDYFYSLEAALDILRRVFPDMYAAAVSAAHHGAGYDELEHLICLEMNARGIPLDTIEGMGYGVPLPAYGVTLHDPDFYTNHPELLPVLQLLGVEAGDDYPIAIPEHVYTISHRLMTSLIEHPDERYQQVGWLMGFIGSCTQNSAIDWPPDVMYEVEPLSWEPDDLTFALAIIEEAEEIMEAVSAGLKLFQSNPYIRPALEHNVQRLHRSLARPTKKERKKHDDPRLHWPALDCGLAGETEPDA